MNLQDIEEQDLLRKYTQGKLTAEETEAFEVYLMENPECLEDLEIDLAFKHYISALPSKNYANESINNSRPTWLAKLLAVCKSPVFSSLATLIVCIGIFMSLPQQANFFDSSQLYYIDNVRSASNGRSVEIALDPETSFITLSIEINSLTATQANLFLQRDNQTIYQQDKALLNEQGELVVVLSASKLEIGDYNLLVITNDSATTTENILLRITHAND